MSCPLCEAGHQPQQMYQVHVTVDGEPRVMMMSVKTYLKMRGYLNEKPKPWWVRWAQVILRFFGFDIR